MNLELSGELWGSPDRAIPVPRVASAQSSLVLVESIVNDAHWTTLSIATLTILMNACSAKPVSWTLRAWRHTLTPHASAMRLALRYGTDVGIDAAAVERLDAVYDRLESLSVRSMPVVSCVTAYSPAQRRELQVLADDWRNLSRSAGTMLRALEPVIKARLNWQYADNNRILVPLVDAAVFKNGDRVNVWGEIDLPRLAQQRRAVRVATRLLGQVHCGDVSSDATIVDLSLTGAGIACRRRLQVGQRLELEPVKGRRLGATVVWSADHRYGLSFAQPLRRKDALFALV